MGLDDTGVGLEDTRVGLEESTPVRDGLEDTDEGWGWRGAHRWGVGLEDTEICMTTRCNILKAVISWDIIEDA